MNGDAFYAERARRVLQSVGRAVKKPAVMRPPLHLIDPHHAMVVESVHIPVLAEVEDVVRGVDGQYARAPALLT